MKEFKERKKPSQPQGTFFKPKVQKKLAIGKPGDKYETEADATADKVTSRSGAPDVQQSAQPEIQQQPLAESVSPVQMKEMGEEDPIQKQPEQDENAVQKKEADDKDPIQKQSEEETPVQQKAEDDQVVQQKEDDQDPVQRKENDASLTTESKLSASKGQGKPVSGKVKQEMESGFGADFSRVRIHTDTPAEQMSQEMNAQAFTHGNDIYFNKGKYDPVSKEGKHLLAHELTHTIQQKGMVQQKVQRHMQEKYPWDGIITNTSSAALREKPGKTKMLAALPNGASVKVMGNSGNWLYVEAYGNGKMQTGYVSQELVALNTGKIADKKKFDQYPTVKESSGWLMGKKGMQHTTASNGIQLGAASLMNYDIVYLVGGLLEQIKIDPDLVKKEKAITGAIKKDKRYKKEPFYLTGTEVVGFGGQRWTSSSENWGSLGSSNPLLHAETWGVAGNQLTWALRNATVKYWADVDAKGKITISYHLNDRLDLSGSPGRSEAYNNISNALGLFYHDLAGGNINMQTRAEWKVIRY